MVKKVISFIALIIILFSSFSFSSFAFEIDQSKGTVDGYYLYDLEHNQIMSSHNIDNPITPASTTKIMTACIVLESGVDLDKPITISKNMISNISGRQMFLKEGNVLTIEDLLYAMLCGGYNDAAHILALTISPSISEFTKKMNSKAFELGMNNTHFANPTGIGDSSMTTTVNDIAKLSKHMAKNELFITICSTKSYKLSATSICEYTTISNRSSLLSQYKGLSSFNVGSSDDGDYAVVFYKISSTTLIAIVMNAKSNGTKTNVAEDYCKDLISHALNDYSVQTLKNANDVITSLPVKYSISSKEINVYLQEDLSVFVPKGIDLDNDISYSVCINDDELVAPISSGDIVGTINVFYDGILLASSPLVVKESVDKNTFLFVMDMIKSFVLSKSFIIALILFVILVIIYYAPKKRKKKRKKRKIRKKPT